MKRVMIKNRMRIAFTILVLGFTSCDKKEDAVANLNDTVTLKTNDASQTDLDGLIYMREEEKLAHDVCVNSFNQWNLPVFDFISRSENIHISQVLSLINFFNLEDPASVNAGQFNNPGLQTLYDQLMAQGSESLISALTVGATIEEVDIVDLSNRMEMTTNNAILNVFGNLTLGSKAHLRAFVAQLRFQGVTYIPQFLSQEEFDAIINGD